MGGLHREGQEPSVKKLLDFKAPQKPQTAPPFSSACCASSKHLPLVNPTILSAFHTHSPLQLRLLRILQTLPLGGGQGSQRGAVGAGGCRRRPPRAPPLRGVGGWVSALVGGAGVYDLQQFALRGGAEVIDINCPLDSRYLTLMRKQRIFMTNRPPAGSRPKRRPARAACPPVTAGEG